MAELVGVGGGLCVVAVSERKTRPRPAPCATAARLGVDISTIIMYKYDPTLLQKHAETCRRVTKNVAGWSYGNLRKTLSYGITINPQVDDYSLVLQI